jgi:hypothetical protein
VRAAQKLNGLYNTPRKPDAGFKKIKQETKRGQTPYVSKIHIRLFSNNVGENCSFENIRELDLTL